MLLLFYMFEVGKAKTTTQSVLMILTLNDLFQKKSLDFHYTLRNSRQNKAVTLETPYNCVTPFIKFKAIQDLWKFPLMFSWSRLKNSTLFLSHKNKFIAIKNAYLSEWFFLEIKNFYLSIKEISILKSNYF